MGGKTWSKKEERFFWEQIIPQSPKAVKRPLRIADWEECAQIMQRAMGEDARRAYTKLMLFEHYFQNVKTGHRSPFARKFVYRHQCELAGEEKPASVSSGSSDDTYMSSDTASPGPSSNISTTSVTPTATVNTSPILGNVRGPDERAPLSYLSAWDGPNPHELVSTPQIPHLSAGLHPQTAEHGGFVQDYQDLAQSHVDTHMEVVPSYEIDPRLMRAAEESSPATGSSVRSAAVATTAEAKKAGVQEDNSHHDLLKSHGEAHQTAAN